MTRPQQPLSVGSFHIDKEQPGHGPSTTLPAFRHLSWLFVLFLIVQPNSVQWQGKHLHFTAFAIPILMTSVKDKGFSNWIPFISIHTMATVTAVCFVFSGSQHIHAGNPIPMTI